MVEQPPSGLPHEFMYLGGTRLKVTESSEASTKPGQLISPSVNNNILNPYSMSLNHLNNYIENLDAFNGPRAVLMGFVMMAARQYSTSVFYIAGKASAENFGPFEGDYVPFNGGMEWMPFDKAREFPHGMATWVLPLGLYQVFLVPSKEEMFKPKQELYLAVDEKGGSSNLSHQDVENLLNTGVKLPVPKGLFASPNLDSK
jgi:hypothetical protein